MHRRTTSPSAWIQTLNAATLSASLDQVWLLKGFSCERRKVLPFLRHDILHFLATDGCLLLITNLFLWESFTCNLPKKTKRQKKTMFWRLLWAGPSSDNSFPKKKDGHWSVTKTKHVFLGGHVYRWSLIYIWQVVPETWPEISKWFKVYLVQLAFGILWLYIHHPRLCPLYLHVANYFRLCLARPNSCWPCHVCWISPVLCWLYPSTLLVDDMLRIYNRSLPARIFHVDTHTHPYISIVCRIGARTNLRETTRFDAKNHGSQIQIPSGNQTWQHLGRWFSHSHAHV